MGTGITRRHLLAGLAGKADAAAPRFRFEPLGDRPVFDVSPHHARMCSCYRDRRGVYHLFTDYIDAAQRTVASWGAEIRYYTSPNLRDWEFVDTPVPRGRWRGRSRHSDLDWYGAASPHVLVTYGQVHLFYAGREHHDGPEQNLTLGRLRCRIFVATSRTDRHGAPARAFRKRGVVLEPGPPEAWDSLRLDDPCAVRAGDTVFLYYKGRPGWGGAESARVGRAAAVINSRKFFRRPPGPVLAVDGGCEMPRVFRHQDQWHMFLRHFVPGDGAVWKHYRSEDGIGWRLHDANLFDCAGPEPGRGAADVSLVRGFDGAVAEPITALATGFENGALKLWAYRVAVR